MLNLTDGAKPFEIDIENIMLEYEGTERPFEKKTGFEIIKRIFDIVASFSALAVLWPFLVLVGILICADDGKGKPLFSQTRVGKNGKKFKLYKFRTMCVEADDIKDTLRDLNEADGPAFKIKDDPRVTKIGKFLRSTNIDELPQLLNILVGDMSVVGPRPPLPDEVAQYTEQDKIRLLVRPGLTCYWQVSRDRNDISFARWMELDRKYIAERSPLVDLKLIFGTIASIIVHHDGR